MAQKTTIGICYFFDNHTNSGIVNYIYNIISSLNTLSYDEKPRIIVFYAANTPVEFLKGINYPFVRFMLFQVHSPVTLIRKLNSLIKRILHVDLYTKFRYFNKVDCVYPYFDFADFGFKKAKNKIHWLVDLNHKAFPGHHDPHAISMMDAFYDRVTALPDRVVLSSYSLLKEFQHYYPAYTCEVKILRFASSIPALNDSEIGALMQKHGIVGAYFMSPNQFWEHKNQAVVLDALHVAKKHYPDTQFTVLFTGSLVVHRGKGMYAETLSKKIEDYKLENQARFLGVLDRKEQLLLMKHSLALIQPSLYEGWSTLVEEAKALNKFIFLSDLPVHREQISGNAIFFDPYNEKELAEKMVRFVNQLPEQIPVDYAEDITAFGKCVKNALTF